MRVGLTYDLRDDYLAEGFGEEETAEFDSPDTIRALQDALAALGHEPLAIGHARALAARLAAGERWDLVFNIAEGLYGFGREGLVPALLDAYRVPYVFSDPMVMGLTLHKAMAKRVVRDCGVPTADFRLVENAEDVAKIDLPYPLFAKPVAEGTGKGIATSSKVNSAGELATVCRDLLVRFQQPVLVEIFLPGREYTVGIVGSGEDAYALGVLEVSLRGDAEPEAYGYINKEHYERFVDYRLEKGPLARHVAEVALAAWRALGCQDGGRVDLRLDARGIANFLEVNPLAGLHPVRSDLPILARQAGMTYRELIARIIAAALARLGMNEGARRGAASSVA
jgi:D-alanine-D-alanine ligase